MNNTITPLEFLDKFIHNADGIIQRAIERRREVDQDSDSEVEEDPQDTIIERDEDPIIEPNVDGPNQARPPELCLSCNLQITNDKFILNCGQQPFCNDCTENILAVDHATCPVCNMHVTMSIKILQNQN